MNVLLDTSAYSAILRGHQPVLDVLRRSETVAVSAVVLGELYSGFRAGNRWAEHTAQLAQFLSKPSVRVLNVTEETALRYAEVDVYLREKGRPIPRMMSGSQRLPWSTGFNSSRWTIAFARSRCF